MTLQTKATQPVDVGVRELHNRTSEVIKRVAAGEEIFITLHGRRTAKLVPAQSADPLAEFRRRGLVRDPIDGDDSWLYEEPIVPTGSVSDLIAEQRR
ncbi:MAG: type II toxin-antitoxin system prevent-host-death family antitoxin [Solirubrobacterales bacterium]